MGVAKDRGINNLGDYVTVRRSGPHGEETVSHVQTTLRTTTVVDRVLASSNTKRDDDDDDDEGSVRQPFTTTVTVPLSQPAATALPNRNATELPPPQRAERKGMGLSETTHHLLIAAGSIGATIILVMGIFAIYTMRKRNLTFREVISHSKHRLTRRGAPPIPPKNETWDRKPAYDANYGSTKTDGITRPQRAMSLQRSDSGSSQKPLMALQRSESLTNRPPEQFGSQGTFLLDSPPPRRHPSHRRNNSITPSSPTVFPLQTQRRRSESHRNTRSISDASELQYPEPPINGTLSALPPPPTFKQFLSNRPSVSGRMNAAANGMVSRFSWTNSNAPQTPHDMARDTNSHMVGRDSFMTQRSSVPRFRTIDSWVNQQAGRIDEQKLHEQLGITQSSTAAGEGVHSSIPEVPEIPRQLGASGLPPSPPQAMPTDNEAQMYNNHPPSIPPKSPLPPTPHGLPGKNVKHERQDTKTTLKTASIFRAHPGKEIRFSTRSAVPSEILDMGRTPNVLS